MPIRDRKMPKLKSLNLFHPPLAILAAMLLPLLALSAGCQLAGLASVAGSPTGYETKTPAEFDLTEHPDKKILVLVNQPAYFQTQENLRFYLTDAILAALRQRIELLPENLIDYDRLADFRSTRPDFAMLTPAHIGRAIDANLVLLVELDNYELYEMESTGYHKGFLAGRVSLIDVQTQKKIWPADNEKDVQVGFEVEPKSREIAVARLVLAFAHCSTRYLYDCPKRYFQIADDRSRVGWKDWQ